MKNGLVIADTGSIISLASINKLDLLEHLFDEVKIPNAVWEELIRDESKPYQKITKAYFSGKVEHIHSFNDLSFIMDYGESESVILYKELNANFLLIDDKKARSIAENLDVKCIGTLGLLMTAKKRGLIGALKPIFIQFLRNKRYYSIDLLNSILVQMGESSIE